MEFAYTRRNVMPFVLEIIQPRQGASRLLCVPNLVISVLFDLGAQTNRRNLPIPDITTMDIAKTKVNNTSRIQKRSYSRAIRCCTAVYQNHFISSTSAIIRASPLPRCCRICFRFILFLIAVHFSSFIRFPYRQIAIQTDINRRHAISTRTYNFYNRLSNRNMQLGTCDRYNNAYKRPHEPVR